MLDLLAWSVILFFVAAFVVVGGYILLTALSEHADRSLHTTPPWRIIGQVVLLAAFVWCVLDALRLL